MEIQDLDLDQPELNYWSCLTGLIPDRLKSITSFC